MTGSTGLTRWGAPLAMIAIGIGFSIYVAIGGETTGVRPTPGVLSGLPVVSFIALLLVRATSASNGRVSDLVVTLMISFLIGLHVLFIAVGIGLTDRFEVLVPLLTSILFLALAPTIASLESGSAMGLRVPATMADAGVWRTVHRRLGLAFAVAGILGVISSLTAPKLAVFVAGGIPLVSMILLAVTARAPAVEQSPAPERPNDQAGS